MRAPVARPGSSAAPSRWARGLVAASALAIACGGGAKAPSRLEVSPASTTASAGGPPVRFTALADGAPAVASWSLSSAIAGTLSAGSGSAVDYLPPDDASGLQVLQVTATAAGLSAAANLYLGPSPGPQTARPLGSTGAPNGFYEYLPPSYGDGQPRPLLVFWHGSGESGNGTTELARVLANGPPRELSLGRWPASRPFVVLSAQHGGLTCPTGAEQRAFLEWALASYRIDAKQVFLTGLSCGAIGAWDYLGDYTDERVAAVLLVAGDPGTAWGRAGCALGKVAIRAIHGAADPVVPIGAEQQVMDLLSACPAPPRRDVEYTVLPAGGHDVWTAAYAGDLGDVYGWLLSRPKP